MESFHSRPRDELLATEEFESLAVPESRQSVWKECSAEVIQPTETVELIIEVPPYS